MFIRFIAILFCIHIVFAASMGARADMMELKDMKELSYAVDISKQEFDDNTDLYSATPNKETDIAYTMRLPRKWRKVSVHGLKIKLSDKILTEVAEYYGPPLNGRRSSFRVSVMEMGGVMSLEHWYVNYVITNAFTLQGYKKLHDNRVEGVYVVLEAGISYVVRTAAIINGGYLVIAEYKAPIEIYNQEKNNLIWAITSFRMKNPLNNASVDSVNYSFLDVAELDYPSNWYLKKATIDSMEFMYLLLAYGDKGITLKLNDTISMKGRIEIQVFAKTSDPEPFVELSRAQMEFEDYGFIIDVRDDKLKYKGMTDGFKIIHSELMFLKHESGSFLDYELWDVIVDSDEYIFVISMISPARGDDFDSWARNVGTLKFVVESIR